MYQGDVMMRGIFLKHTLLSINVGKVKRRKFFTSSPSSQLHLPLKLHFRVIVIVVVSVGNPSSKHVTGKSLSVSLSIFIMKFDILFYSVTCLMIMCVFLA